MSRISARLLAGIGLALGFALLLTVHVLVQGITGADAFRQAAADPNFAAVFGVNFLIGLSFLMFVAETGRGTIRVVLTIVAALLIGFGIMLLISGDPLKAYRALLTGPISRLNRWGNWIDDTLALMLVGLALALVFRARLFSLGAEGQITLGALAAGLVALGMTGLPAAIHIPLALAAGCFAGFLWGLIPGYLRAYLDANELVSTLMLNPIAALLYEMALTAIKPASAGYVVSAPFPDSALLPPIVSGTHVTTGIVFVAAAVLLAWLLVERTPLGYELRLIGANLRFAHYGGIDTKRAILRIMAISGILAGLTGGYLALAIQRRLILGISAGLTFEGVVVALLARNNPLAVPAMALLYSFLRVGGPIMQTDANVSADIVRLIQAIIILLFTADGLVTFIGARRARLKGGSMNQILTGIFSAAFLGAILRVTTPILLPSLGALISQQAGVINIGLEGIMLAAAFTGATVGAQVAHELSACAAGSVIAVLAGFGAALAVAVLMALLLALFHLRLGADLILSGIALNILASAGTAAIGFQLTGQHSGDTGLAGVTMPTISLPFLQTIPLVGDVLYTVFGGQNVMTWIAFLAVIELWFLMYRMPVGYHLRAVGENPDAAASVGIDVRRTRTLALVLSGVLAGLGGIHLSMGYLTGFTRDMTASRGFIALVAPALGGGAPFGTMLAALLFGGFAALETRLPSLLPGVPIPSQLPQMFPYAATILALVVYAIRRRRMVAVRARRGVQAEGTEVESRR